MRRGMREEAEASRLAEVEREKKLVRVNEFITVSELAQILKVSPTEIVAFAFKNLGPDGHRSTSASTSIRSSSSLASSASRPSAKTSIRPRTVGTVVEDDAART